MDSIITGDFDYAGYKCTFRIVNINYEGASCTLHLQSNKWIIEDTFLIPRSVKHKGVDAMGTYIAVKVITLVDGAERELTQAAGTRIH